MANFLGRGIDYLGTKLKLPEIGFSEFVGGGKTQNTLNPAGNDYSISNRQYGITQAEIYDPNAQLSQRQIDRALGNTAGTNTTDSVAGASTDSTILNGGFQYTPSTGTTSSSSYYGVAPGAASLAQSQADAQKAAVEEAQRLQAEAKQKEIDATMGIIGNRRNVLSQDYNQNQQLAESQYGQNVNQAQSQTDTTLAQIDRMLADALNPLGQQKTTITENAAKARSTAEDALRRNFEGRGALDSSFYAKALAEGFSNIGEQELNQIKEVDNAITSAVTQTKNQKENITQQLNSTILGLQQKKQAYLAELDQAYRQGNISLDELQAQTNIDASQFASEQEISKIGQLQQIQFNLDNYLLELADRQAQASAAIQSSTNTTGLNSIIETPQIIDTIASGLERGLSPSYFIPALTADGKYDQNQATSLVTMAQQYLDQQKSASENKTLQQLQALQYGLSGLTGSSTK